MTSGLRIRSIEEADLPSLLELYRNLKPSDPPLAPENAASIWKQLSSCAGSTIFVGEKQGVLVTTCTLIVAPNLTRGGLPYASIENVVTASQYRKQGNGGAILKHAIAAAWKLTCYKVMLLTGSTDPATIKFYQEVGFVQNKTGFQIRQSELVPV